MFCVIKIKKVFGIVSAVIGSLLICISVIKLFKKEKREIEVFSHFSEPTYTIIVDAGHGEPDGGAVSKNGVKEAGLNLSIALKLEKALNELGYNVIMTRNTEENIADSDKQISIRSMKVSDINNRIKIVNEKFADMLISIHMNNFENPQYYGWQTFYKKNSEESKKIAENVQNGISKNIARKNDRVALPINGIKLIDKANIPAIIVECGFLSNEEDLRLLLTDEYHEQIVNGIVNGIEKCYEK